jgi:cell wall-associated NlpC family hydrolase
MNERQRKIIAEARKLVGTKFHHQGRVPHVGLDCIGVLVAVASALGLPHQDWPFYKRVPRHSVLSDHLATSGCTPVALEDLAPGHVMTFWYQIDGVENHTGILAQMEEEERPTIIHAYHGAGGVVEHDFNDFWRSRLMNVWALPENA